MRPHAPMECAKRVALPQGLEGYTTRYMLRDPHPLRFSNNGESDANHTTTVDREHTKLKSSKPRQRQLNYSVLPIPIDSHFLIPHRGELGPFFGDPRQKTGPLRIEKRLAIRNSHIWYLEPKWLWWPKIQVNDMQRRCSHGSLCVEKRLAVRNSHIP